MLALLQRIDLACIFIGLQNSANHGGCDFFGLRYMSWYVDFERCNYHRSGCQDIQQ
jgi:hypothetical protein